MALTAVQIERLAQNKGLKFKYVSITDGEFLVVALRFGVTAWFKMNEKELNYNYSHTYSAITDKTTKRTHLFFK